MLERTIRIGTLFDFYGELLTDKQQQMVELYFYHDLSLGEISNQHQISRQAVHDNLNRAEEALEDYEAKLGLVDQYRSMQKQIAKLEEVVADIEEDIAPQDLDRLQRIISNLTD
ncbi:MAG: YlxM family DNA-binding protein [Bacillota bacterium]